MEKEVKDGGGMGKRHLFGHSIRDDTISKIHSVKDQKAIPLPFKELPAKGSKQHNLHESS